MLNPSTLVPATDQNPHSTLEQCSLPKPARLLVAGLLLTLSQALPSAAPMAYGQGSAGKKSKATASQGQDTKDNPKGKGSSKGSKGGKVSKAEGPKTLRLLTLKAPSVYHDLKKSPPTATSNPLENLMRPPLMALTAKDTWHCLLCAKPPELIHGNRKLRHHKLTIVLTLKPTLFWNDGKRVSALDIKHSIEHYNERALKEQGQHRIRVVKMTIDPKKPRRIELSFSYQHQNHLPSLAIPLLPAHLKEKFSGRRAVLATKGFAYGPYTQLTVKDNLFWLHANPYSKTPANPSFQHIHIAAVKGLKAAQLELSKRDYDGILEFYPSLDQLSRLAGLPTSDLLHLAGHKQAVIVLNLRNPVFAKPIYRRALGQQVRAANLPASLMPAGFGLQADSFAFPSDDGQAFWREGWLSTRAIDPQHLSYWADKPLELAVANTPDRLAIAQKIKEALEGAGVTLTIKRYAKKHFLANILKKGRFRTLALMMREGLAGSSYIENFHSTFVPRYPAYTGSNFGSWYNKSVNQWLQKQLYKEDAFWSLQGKIERAYLSDVPEIPLFFWPKVMVTRGNLTGVPLSRNSFSPLLFIQKWRKVEPGPEVSVKSDR